MPAGRCCGCGVRPGRETRPDRRPGPAPLAPHHSRPFDSLDLNSGLTVRWKGRQIERLRRSKSARVIPCVSSQEARDFRYDCVGNFPAIWQESSHGQGVAVCAATRIAAWSEPAGKEKSLIARYTREEMGRVWSEENKFQKWLEVEFAATETLAEAGQVPRAAAAAIRERAQVNVARIRELEARVRHDVIAFTMAVGEAIGDPAAAR